MDQSEEKAARKLHADLVDRFRSRASTVNLSVAGAGVHWHCSVEAATRRCSTACFCIPQPQYLTAFEEDGERIATGRTESEVQSVDAIDSWMRGYPLDAMYDRYAFVDSGKRAIFALRDWVEQHVPCLLAAAQMSLEVSYNEFYRLWLRSEERSCVAGVLQCRFHWDECEIFSAPVADRGQFAKLLERWLCDKVMPSALRAEFPSVVIGELADWYERGNPVEGEFLQSWESAVHTYSQLPDAYAPGASEFLASLRERGYDRVLRAGTSMATLILSRSRRYGLRYEQPRVAFEFRKGMLHVAVRDHGIETMSTFDKVEVNRDIQAMLDHLVTRVVD